jgi:hypothetical protein
MSALFTVNTDGWVPMRLHHKPEGIGEHPAIICRVRARTHGRWLRDK